MLYKNRIESNELIMLRSLNSRMSFSEEESNYLWKLEKGFEGEKKFDSWMDTFISNGIELRDLLLESNNSVFQIDTLFMSKETLYIFEVKNFEGDFYLDNGKWFSKPGNEINNPLDQLKRCETLLRRLIHSLGFNVPIKGYVIFVNPEFHLYQAPLHLPIVYPTQLNRFMNSLKLKPSNIKDQYNKLASKLVSLHIKESPYTRFPDYDYDRLRKGILCPSCRGFYTALNPKISGTACKKCGYSEDIETTVLRSINDYVLLFPGMKITTKGIFEWCGRIISEKRVRRILSRKFILMHHGKSSYYVLS